MTDRDDLVKRSMEALRELVEAEEWFRMMRSETSARELSSARKKARAILDEYDAQGEEEQ